MIVAHPQLAIAALAACCGAIALRLTLHRRSQAQTVQYSSLPFLLAAASAPAWPVRVYLGAWCASAVLAAVAACGPCLAIDVPLNAAIAICIDTSGSMRSRDVAPARLAAAVSSAQRFVADAPASTEFAVVSFAATALVRQYPTSDRARVGRALRNLPQPNGPTAIGDALALAASVLPAGGARTVLLITDGGNNAGSDPATIAAGLRRKGIRIDTVGLGSAIDAATLRAIAAPRGGTFVRASSAVALDEALEKLNRTTMRRTARFDLSLPCALASTILMTSTTLFGAWKTSI